MNRILRHVVSWLGLAVLVACTPTLNWRETHFGDRGLQVLMPCKPDTATRTVQLPSKNQAIDVTLRMQGCEAGDLQFTLAQMTVPEGVAMNDALSAWRAASFVPLSVQSSDVPVQHWRIEDASEAPSPQRAQVRTATHRAQWVWFAQTNQLYQAAVYGDAKSSKLDEAAEVYFSGIKLP